MLTSSADPVPRTSFATPQASEPVAIATRGTGPPGALVLGADYRALGVVRSLGRRGVPVWVLAEATEPLASLSRYARRVVRWPAGGEAELTDFLCHLAVSEGIRGWALIPSADTTVATLARHYDRLADYFVHTTPTWSVVEAANDKRITHALADQVGVSSPWTMSARDIIASGAQGVSFPAVLKPAIKESANALTNAKAWRIEDAGDLERRYAEACEFIDPDLLMLQELIPGGGSQQMSFAALCRDGDALVSLTARRTRQYPPDFGRASTFVETLDAPDVVAPSLRLLRALRYNGLIEIEYKRDPRDGVLKLLDMNLRVWGWHTLCARAGVDFPWLLWQQLAGAQVDDRRARSGVKWLRLSTDTPMAIREILAGRLPLREYVRSLRGARESAIFAADDPIPGLLELPVLVYMLMCRLTRGEAV